MLIGVYPISFLSFFKAKYVVYLGLLVPLAFVYIIGELAKRFKKYEYFIIYFGVFIAILQFVQYYDLLFSSIQISTTANISNITAFFNEVCNKKDAEIKEAYENLSKVSPTFVPFVIKSMAITKNVYCTKIPDWWYDAMLWIRYNRKGEERVMSWWDYGHWTTTIGQGKTVTDNLHSYDIMHQEVADKIVGNSTENLIKYMKEHKAKYLLLDTELIGKWGALVYHYCIYNNQTTMKIGPGNSECDISHYPEYLYAKNFYNTPLTSADLCSLKDENGNKAVRVYSTFGKYYGFNYYCTFDFRTFFYENGTPVDMTAEIQGVTGDNYLSFIAMYPEDSKDKKGYFYNSIFYKGFFEGYIPGMKQVYPDTFAIGPKLPVRIYKIDE
jgi:hypothetical protein